jgi:hypothetical protein
MRPRTHSTTPGHTGDHARAAKATYVPNAVTRQPLVREFVATSRRRMAGSRCAQGERAQARACRLPEAVLTMVKLLTADEVAERLRVKTE